MLVLFHHHFSFLRVSRFAWIGVDLFFVLSGYLVTTGLLNTKNDRGSIFSFYVKRILRIFPLYYLVLAISFLIFKAFPQNGYAYFIHNQAYFWTYTQNWLWAFTGMPPNSIFNHLWSLAIEEQFYICWPLLICYNKPRTAAFGCIGLILLSILLRNTVQPHYFNYFSTFTRIDGLAVGALLALLLKHGNTRYIECFTRISAASFLVVAGWICYSVDFYTTDVYITRMGYTLVPLGFAYILLLSFRQTVTGNMLRRFFSTKFITYTGRISYGLYIYSWIAYVLIYPWLMGFISRTGHADLMMPLLNGIFILLIYGIATISYYFFEQRFLALKHILIYHIKHKN